VDTISTIAGGSLDVLIANAALVLTDVDPIDKTSLKHIEVLNANTDKLFGRDQD
jgi:hypothetical protein